jgi:hypothetical protein
MQHPLNESHQLRQLLSLVCLQTRSHRICFWNVGSASIHFLCCVPFLFQFHLVLIYVVYTRVELLLNSAWDGNALAWVYIGIVGKVGRNMFLMTVKVNLPGIC